MKNVYPIHFLILNPKAMYLPNIISTKNHTINGDANLKMLIKDASFLMVSMYSTNRIVDKIIPASLRMWILENIFSVFGIYCSYWPIIAPSMYIGSHLIGLSYP